MSHYVEVTAGKRETRNRGSRWLVLSLAAGWVFLAGLAVLQDRALDAQRNLIHSLLNDLHENVLEATAAEKPALPSDPQVAGNPDSQASKPGKTLSLSPGIKAPSPSVQSKKQFPSSQVKEGGSKASKNRPKALKELPVTPPSAVVDPSDRRRVKILI